jgi:hypothetical protein
MGFLKKTRLQLYSIDSVGLHWEGSLVAGPPEVKLVQGLG